MLFFAVVVRPLVLIGLGLNVFNRRRLPTKGPAVLAANHNSHLDTLVLMSLYPLLQVHRVRPVAAADYFLTNPLLAWFSLRVLGIVPLDRTSTDKSRLFDGCHKALQQNDILILFPEGSRGLPEQMGKVKKGLFHLINTNPKTVVTPVALHGLGKTMPRGAWVPVPFNCDVVVGKPLSNCTDSNVFIKLVTNTFASLANECITRNDLN